METIRYHLSIHKIKIFAFVCILILFAADRSNRFYQLKGACDAIRDGEYIYILDDSGDYDRILKVDQAGVIHSQITMPNLKGDWWNTYSSLCADQDGTIYIYYYGKTMDMGTSLYQVMACNFASGKLIPVWTLPQDKSIQVQVSNQTVYYLAREPDGSAAFYCQAMNGQPTRLLSPGVPFGQVKLFAWNARYGFLWVDRSGNFYKNKERLTAGFDHPWEYSSIRADEQGIFYTDLERGTAMHLGWADEVPKQLFDLDAYAGIYPLYHNPDGSFIAAADQPGGGRGIVLFDNQGEETGRWNTLTKTASSRVMFLIQIIGAGLLVGAAFWVLKNILFHFTNGMVPILLQLLSLVLPVIVLANAWINLDIKATLENRILKLQYDLLYVIVDNQLSGWDPDLLEQIDWQDVVNDPIYQKIFYGVDYSTLEKQIYEKGSDDAEAIISNPYTWVYLQKDGELRYLEADGRQFYGARVLYDRGPAEYAKMAEAMGKYRIIGSQYSDLGGSYIVLYVPVISQHGEAVGVVECGVNRRILTYEVQKQMDQIHRILAGILIFAAAGIALLLGYCLKPLGILREAVEDASQGNLGRDVVVKGRNEVSRIARSFNHMSAQLKEHMDFIEECSKRYATFVPRKVFEILKHPDITQVELGDQNEIQAAILDVESRQFQQMAKKMDGDALYGMVNHMLRTMISIISDGDGIVDHMAGNGLLAYYPDHARQPLMAAVSICEDFNRQVENGAAVPLYRMVLHYGSVRVGIIGEETRMAAGTISEAMTLVAFLREVSDRYQIRILVTESIRQQIPELADRFHSRMIGYLHLSTTDSLEIIYDVYDGDLSEQRRAKAETGELFARALNDYLAAKYYDARLKFARVLRRNPRDLVAREYIYRCDDYQQNEGQKKPDIWLEQY